MKTTFDNNSYKYSGKKFIKSNNDLPHIANILLSPLQVTQRKFNKSMSTKQKKIDANDILVKKVNYKDSQGRLVFTEQLKREESDLQLMIKKMIQRIGRDKEEPTIEFKKVLKVSKIIVNDFVVNNNNTIKEDLVKNSTEDNNVIDSNGDYNTNSNLISNSISAKSKIKKEKIEDKNRKIKKMKEVYDSLSEDENHETLFFRSHSAAAKSYFKANVFLINPNGSFKTKWSLLIVLLILYCVFVCPVRNSFQAQIPNQKYDDLDTMFFFEVVIDTLFIFDIILNFFVAFYDDEENLIVRHDKIIKNYLEGWFLWDLITSIPSSYVNLIIYYYHINSSSIIRIHIAIKWQKVVRIFKLFYNSSYQENAIYKKFFSEKKSSVVTRYAIIFIVLVHLSTCIWCYIGNFIDDSCVSWIVRDNLNDKTDFDVYFSSMYYILASVFTIGYGDIAPQSLSERIFILFVCLVGVFVYSLAISWLGNKFSHYDKKTLKLERKLMILDDIKREFKIPRNLSKSIQKYIEMQFHFDLIARYKFIESLPTNLKNQLIYVMSKNQIKKHKFFHNVSYDFFRFVVPMILTVKLHKNDLLFSIGGYVEEMYMVNQGTLSLRLGKLYHSIEVAKLGVSQHFGEILMYSHEVSNFDLKVKTNHCEVYIIRKNDFSKIKLKFPEIILEKLKMSYKIYHKILQRRKFYIELVSKLPVDVDKYSMYTYLKKAQKISMQKFNMNNFNYNINGAAYKSELGESTTNTYNNTYITNNTIFNSISNSISSSIIKEANTLPTPTSTLLQYNSTLGNNKHTFKTHSSQKSSNKNLSYKTNSNLKDKSQKQLHNQYTIDNDGRLHSIKKMPSLPALDELDAEDKSIIINITNIENNINNHFLMMDKFTVDNEKNKLGQIGTLIQKEKVESLFKGQNEKLKRMTVKNPSKALGLNRSKTLNPKKNITGKSFILNRQNSLKNNDKDKDKDNALNDNVKNNANSKNRTFNRMNSLNVNMKTPILSSNKKTFKKSVTIRNNQIYRIKEEEETIANANSSLNDSRKLNSSIDYEDSSDWEIKVQCNKLDNIIKKINRLV